MDVRSPDSKSNSLVIGLGIYETNDGYILLVDGQEHTSPGGNTRRTGADASRDIWLNAENWSYGLERETGRIKIFCTLSAKKIGELDAPRS